MAQLLLNVWVLACPPVTLACKWPPGAGQEPQAWAELVISCVERVVHSWPCPRSWGLSGVPVGGEVAQEAEIEGCGTKS